MKLLPFQIEGARWLANRRYALLADDMGLGKTVQALAAARACKVKSAIVVCPAAVKHQWQEQAPGWLGFDPIVTSFNKAREVAAQVKHADLMIIDEGHFLKSPQAARSGAVIGTKGLIHRVDRCWSLTGTPMPAHAGDLWTWMYVTGAISCTYDEWVKRYCLMNRWKSVKGSRKSAIPELRKLLRPFILRRLREKVLPELPPLTVSTINVKTVKVSPDQLELWFPSVFIGASEGQVVKQIREWNHKLKEEAEHVQNAIASGNPWALEEITHHVSSLRKYHGMMKMRGVADTVIEEIQNGAYKKIVVFAVHRNVLFGLKDAFTEAGIKSVMMFGGSKKREKVISDFTNDDRVQVFIGQMASAGTGLDSLQRVCSQVLLAEQDWGITNLQAIARLHRMGQKFPVNARIATAAGTIDEQVGRVWARKAMESTLTLGDEA